jgi:hypothetical protein
MNVVLGTKKDHRYGADILRIDEKPGKLTTIVSDSRHLKDLERYPKVCKPILAITT